MKGPSMPGSATGSLGVSRKGGFKEKSREGGHSGPIIAPIGLLEVLRP